VAFEVLDAQAHASPKGAPCAASNIPQATADEMIGSMDYAEVDGAILVVPRGCGWDNSYSLDLASRVPERFRVVGRANYLAPDVAEQIEEFARHPMAVGLRVVVLDPKMHEDLAAGLFDRYLTAATNAGLTVCFTGSPYLETFDSLVRQYPDTQWVIDHFGLGGYIPHVNTWESLKLDERIPRILKFADYPNVAMKATAGPSLSREWYPFLDVRPLIESYIDAYGIDRMMWGTDWTRVTNASYRSGVDYLREADWLSDDLKVPLFATTARRIFNWPR
jgi:L-fuconolactonase